MAVKRLPHGSAIPEGFQYCPGRVAIVTHRWRDPVEDKEFVGLSFLRRDGSHDPRPSVKHTIRGLALQGWRSASRDWVAWLRERESGIRAGRVVPMGKARKRDGTGKQKP